MDVDFQKFRSFQELAISGAVLELVLDNRLDQFKVVFCGDWNSGTQMHLGKRRDVGKTSTVCPKKS